MLLIYTLLVVLATVAVIKMWLTLRELAFAYRVRAHQCTEPGCVLQETFAHVVEAMPKTRIDVGLYAVLLLVTLVGVGAGAHLLTAR